MLDRVGGFLEYHDLKTRRSGDTLFMDVHICMMGDVTLSQAHDLSVQIEKELEIVIPGIVPNIHIEDQEWCQKTYARKD